MKEKLKSPVMWLCLAAIVMVMCKNLFGFDIEGTINDVADTVLLLIAAFGVINNPDSRNHF